MAALIRAQQTAVIFREPPEVMEVDTT